MPRRHPRCPSIGLNSCNCSTRASRQAGLLQISDTLHAVVFVLLNELFFLFGAVRRQQRNVDHQIFAARQELVQRRIQRANRHRQSVHRLEDAGEVLPLQRQQLVQCFPAILLVVRENHRRASGQSSLRRRTCARCGRARCLPRRMCAPGSHREECRHWHGLSSCDEGRPTA